MTWAMVLRVCGAYTQLTFDTLGKPPTHKKALCQALNAHPSLCHPQCGLVTPPSALISGGGAPALSPELQVRRG